ncbi:MAG: hypothetical protein KF729_04935 [Sandaracinaceae bacterium]|nr:hypothetical protein [Sandaracinaceae bacterium]
MAPLTSLREAVTDAFRSLADEEATARSAARVDGALEGLLAPGARTWLTGARSELLDLCGLVARRVASEGAVLVLCGPEPALPLARRWLHAQARVARSRPISREGWVRLCEAAASMTTLDVSFLPGDAGVAPPPGTWRAVLDLRADGAREWLGELVGDRTAVLCSGSAPPSADAWWCAQLDWHDDTVRVLRAEHAGDVRATELYYDASSGFLWELAPERP